MTARCAHTLHFRSGETWTCSARTSRPSGLCWLHDPAAEAKRATSVQRRVERRTRPPVDERERLLRYLERRQRELEAVRHLIGLEFRRIA